MDCLRAEREEVAEEEVENLFLSDMLAEIISTVAGYLVRLEGRKFLQLEESDLLDLHEQTNRMSIPALYIHIPFCRKPCSYCSFNRYELDEELARRYFKNLKREVGFYLERGLEFNNVYIGGGTPTVMMDELTCLIEYLHKNLQIEAISLETNPDDVTVENISILKGLNVKRLSMGVQSFNDDLLRDIGRMSHTGREAVRGAEMAQGEFDTFNVDILYNLPTQTLAMFRRDVETALNLGVDQITFYPLMPAKGRRVDIEKSVGKIDFVRERAFFEYVVDRMLESGYKPSTCWCFSRGEQMIDEYIIDCAEYIAVGSGSVGLFNGTFYVNSFLPGKYCEMVESGKLPVVMYRELSRHEVAYYHLLTYLFGMGILDNRRRISEEVSILDDMKGEIGLLKLLGVVDSVDGEVRVKRDGMYLISVMMREFFTALNDLRYYCRVEGL